MPSDSTGAVAIDTSNKHERVAGYDVARAVAICGMVLINFGVYLLGSPHGGPGEVVLRWLAHLPGGRASSLFVTLAGVGIARMAYGDVSSARRTLLVRAALLLGLGALNLRFDWYIDILHFYACYLAIAAIFFLRATPRALLGSALAFAALGPVIAIAIPEDARPYAPPLSPIGLLRDALIDGVHPVVPWLAFLLYGMWLGRLDLREPSLRRSILARALAAFVTIEVVSLVLSVLAVRDERASSFLSLTHAEWSPSALYVLSAASSATAIIALAHEAVARAPGHRLVRIFGGAGQLSLTIYLVHAHLAIGIPRFLLGQAHAMRVEWMLLYWVAFVLVVLPLAALYRRYFTRGPVEWLMRRISGSPEHVAPIAEASARVTEPSRPMWIALAVAIALLPIADVLGTTPPTPHCDGRRSIALHSATASQITLLCPRARFSLDLDTAAPTLLTTRSGMDVYLEVREHGAMVAEDDDSGVGLDSRIERTLGPGHYEVDVRPYSASTGPFVLVVKR
jgi:uncharacterized membrane protein YeiB